MSKQLSRDDAKALVGFGSAMVAVGLIGIEEFTDLLVKTENWVIEEEDWVSRSFLQVLMHGHD